MGCAVGSSSIGILGGTVLIDGILESSGHDKIFHPYTQRGIDSILGVKNKPSGYNGLGLEAKKYISESGKFHKELEDLDNLLNNLDYLSKLKSIDEKDINNLREEINIIKQNNIDKINNNGGKIYEAYQRTFSKKGE